MLGKVLSILFFVMTIGLSACSCRQVQEEMVEGEDGVRLVHRNDYLAIDGSSIGASNELEVFLDLSQFVYKGDVVLFIPYIGGVDDIQMYDDIMSYAMRGVSGNATIVYMEMIPAFSLKQGREVIAYKRSQADRGWGFEWDFIDLDEVEISPSDNPFEKMVEHYEASIDEAWQDQYW